MENYQNVMFMYIYSAFNKEKYTMAYIMIKWTVDGTVKLVQPT